ncbi:putative NADPH-dependent FMN reductase Lot6 [Tricladium varicosporioides]|nr:putative NADPH-dependent FMN reductase Lot6 [Hymenoscyphus varicosporioides]
MKSPSIGVIICSSRQPRVCPQITDFVVSTIKSIPFSSDIMAAPTLNIVDLLQWDLPMFNEPTIPSQIYSASNYKQPHTQNWSREISKHDAFIFVAPQYNWGYPAVLKNAIDYLFNEWKGKPAMIITYGGHGGGKCAAQLRQVFDGIHMVNLKTNVELSFPNREVTKKAAFGEDIGLKNETGSDALWDDQRPAIGKAWGEMVETLTSTLLNVTV